MASTAFHPGEQALQQRAGAYERMAEVGPRVIRAFMPQQHREFFAELPFLLLGTLDAQGQPWASVLAGPPGFMHSPDPQRLRVDVLPDVAGAPVLLAAGAPVGLLGIQPHTRRRNRMNGWIEALDEGGFTVKVAQSFGNCPKYIRPREAIYAPSGSEASRAQRLDGLDERARDLIGRADTFFIATAHPEAAAGDDPAVGGDVSHRGGPAGFVGVEGRTLLVPDYIGNSFFNTLGNLQLNPRCGLLFIDRERGDLLYLAAQASLQWGGPAVQAVPGALRLLRLEVTQALRAERALPLRWRE